MVAAATSHLVFVVAYALGVPAGPASATGFLAGVAPNYVLSRRWAFGRRGRSGLATEVLPYAGLVVSSLLLTVAGTDLAERWIVTFGLDPALRVVAVTAAFAGIQGVLFVAKYLVLDRWVFGGPPQGVELDDDRSRHQVPTSTRP